MRTEDLILVSTDDHVIEPTHLFEGRLPKKYVDAAPRFVTRDDGTMAWVYGDAVVLNPAVQAVVGRPKSEWGMDPVCREEMRPGVYDIHSRVKDMDVNGMLGSMCFPSFVRFSGALFLENGDRDQSAAMVRAYNDWHVDEWAGTYPGRFIPLAIPILWDPELAAEEIRRMARKGCHAVTFTSNPYDLGLPSIYQEHWDPFWRACEEEGTVVCMHIGSNSKAPTTSPDAPVELIYSLSPIGSFEAAADLVWSRLFLKFPNLKVALSEGGIGWVPYFLERLDYLYQHTQHWSGMDLQGRLPSELFNSNVITCFIDDEVGIDNLHRLNIDNVTWECDYPHSDTMWPESPEGVMRYMKQLSDEQINKVTHLNAMKHFKYDPFAHISREQATVGALRARDPNWDTSVVATAHKRPQIIVGA
ncbi:amidohydrolase family protein [Tomitella biformata]|uniref:amidohydrolase family protein n=1 Tax=Tomitella biformata TaxID=630403 RepID=UPI000463715D|nr:amidohydrolase family protein [Tomitella biformata]